MNQSHASSRKVINMFSLAMINIAAIQSVTNLPSTATYGYSLVLIILFAAVIFFIPCCLVTAELATTWPTTGGIYEWVKDAFGDRIGFLAIWLQWVENVFWYPVLLTFAAGVIAYIINPDLANNRVYMLSFILIVYWGITFVNFKGMKLSGLISTLGVIGGTLIPTLFIVALGCYWVLSGNPVQIKLDYQMLNYDLASINNIVFIVSILLGLTGVEMAAVHAKEVRNPKKDYPRAIFLAAVLILFTSILAALAIALVVPRADISIVAGITQAFEKFLGAYHLEWLTPIMAGLIAIGIITSVSTWIVGPSKGLLATAYDGHIPPLFQRTNKNNMPVPIMILQAILLSILSLVFLFMPNVSSSYWILTALTAQLYLIMYVLMFAAAIVLRYKIPHIERPFKIPGGNWGMWIVAGIGLLGSLFAITIGFFPPGQVQTGSIIFYESFLISGIIIMCALPMLIYMRKKPHWYSNEEK